MKSEACKKCLKGVNCDVAHCLYHGENNTCHASEIAVGPHHAATSHETACATFKAKVDPLTTLGE
ncbi:MAG: DUF1540 domain-containing protein [Clostridia bacterium]|nr:DUF1540 domain-containing protein [Clostridia bacterium]